MDIFDRQVAAYDSWKQNLTRQILHFHNWSKKYNFNYEEGSARIHRALKILQGDSITLAFVGELSRGKTELINALFFNELGFRLLPSLPGRTTMCPTELFYDAKLKDNAVRLLPIETRRTAASLESFRKIPNKWITLKFDPKNQDEINRVMSEVAKSKNVTFDEAEALGFDIEKLKENSRDMETIEIPAWRHALINIDHILLRKGLRIIDTPGLNALGSEPELTLSTLPNANAIIFMLGADTGVTASDKDIWETYLKQLYKQKQVSVFALLNKIDVLWDELADDDAIENAIEEVRWQTARSLDLSNDQVLTLSAKQGVTAKAKDDALLMMKSKLVDLETLLSKRVLFQQESLVENTVISDVLVMMDDSLNTIKEKMFEFESQINSIKAIHTDIEAQEQELLELRKSIKKDHSVFQRQVISLKSSRKTLKKEADNLTQAIHENRLALQIEQVQEEFNKSWTTRGLGKAMDRFFGFTEENIDLLDKKIYKSNRLLESIYKKFETENHSTLLKKNKLDISNEKIALEQLEQHSQRMKGDLKTILSDKNTVIELFYNTIIERANEIYRKIDVKIQNWANESLAPLIQNSTYQKQLLEQHITQLTSKESKIKSSTNHLRVLQTRINELNKARAGIEKLIQDINPLTIPESGVNNVVHMLQRREA